MSIATARDWLKRSAERVKRSSQLRSSVVTTVPVRSRRFRSCGSSPVTSTAASNRACWTSAMAGIGTSVGSTSSMHMVVAQISVGEHIVADRLAGAQAAAMADHQPGLGPHHREMVADRLGVGRADADIDQGDAFAVRARSGDRPASGAAASRPRRPRLTASGVSLVT